MSDDIKFYQNFSDGEIELFVGKRWERYKEVWNDLKTTGKRGAGSHNVNLIATLLLPVWLGWRKMYAHLAILCGVLVVFVVVMMKFDTAPADNKKDFGLIGSILPAIMMWETISYATCSRTLYLKQACKKIQKIKSQGLTEEQTIKLIQKKGAHR